MTFVSGWLIDPPSDPGQKDELEARKKIFSDAGFDGQSLATSLRKILVADKHLRECCAAPIFLALALDRFYVNDAVALVSSGVDINSLAPLWTNFEALVYGSGRFSKISFSHLYNFHSIEALDLGKIKIERVDSRSVSHFFGGGGLPTQFHSTGVGEFFITIEEHGDSEDIVKWIFEKHNEAYRLGQILPYFKDGVVHIDYTVPRFKPEWVNSIRIRNTFFIGEPRRESYLDGNSFYSLNEHEIVQLRLWWTAYNSTAVATKMDDLKNKFRQRLMSTGEYFEANLTRKQPVERLISLAIALESLFSIGEKTELQFKLAQLTAQAVGNDKDERKKIYKAIKEFYKRRSSLFHGDYNVIDYSEGRFVTHQEVDEWSSLIRRAYLRLLVCYLKGFPSREDLVLRLYDCALDGEAADQFRLDSDPDPSLEVLAKEAGAGCPIRAQLVWDTDFYCAHRNKPVSSFTLGGEY